jgi:hypothetical protein
MATTLVKQPSSKVLKKLTLVRQQSLASQLTLQDLYLPSIVGTTYWEELECVGYNPELSQLEAVVNVKQSGGYSGNLCTLGSPEFVRFFLDFKDGSGFQDFGLTSFRAHDISEAPAGPQHPISYMVSVEVDASAKTKFCNTEVIPTVRAILSWNSIPSTNPNAVPYYGNVLDADIVLKPRVKLTFPINPVLVQSTIPILPEMIDLKKESANGKVDIKSYLKASLKKGISANRTFTQLLAVSNQEKNYELINQLKAINLEEFDINIEEVLTELGTKDFNVGYEQLESVGLNTAEDTLGAIINIKRPAGYGGDLCKNGSYEYVSFWGDFNNNGTFEKYLGTASVKVHDIKNIPPDGLRYGVFLKTDLSNYLDTCNNPKVVRVRAILSWATPPNIYNPEQQVTWGSSMDRLVQLRPKKQTSLIYSIGNVQVSEISPVTNLAYPGNTGMGNNRPWGGAITIKGGIDNSGAPGATKYRVEYSKDGMNWYPVTFKQKITTIDFSNPVDPFTTHDLEDPNGWFPYLANHNASNLVVIKQQMLATWSSHPFEGKHYVRVRYTKGDPMLPGTTIFSTPAIAIKLDNDRYKTNLIPNNILDADIDLDVIINGGECKTYTQGTKITGKLKVKDQYYGGYSLHVQPQSQVITNAGLITYDPVSNRNNANIGYYGPNADDWEVDSAKLKACGYTLRLIGYERTILNSRHDYPWRDKYVGFAIK